MNAESEITHLPSVGDSPAESGPDEDAQGAGWDAGGIGDGGGVSLLMRSEPGKTRV